MSPIVDLTDQGEMGFPKIGNVRKGEEKGKSRFPKDLDYFRVEFDEHETEAAEIFLREYGAEPKEILIWLPYKEIDDCWEAWLEGYTAGALQARSDGANYIFLREPDTGEILVKDGIDLKTGRPRPYDPNEPAVYYTDSKNKKQPVFLKATGRLEVIIPVLERLASLTLHTGSKNDIAEISKNLKALYFVNSGSLQNIDILLKRKPRMISSPGEGGKRVRREKNLIFLETAPTWVQKQVNGLRMRAELQPVEIAGGLESGIDADELTGEIIDGDVTEVKSTPPPKEPKRKKKEIIEKPWPARFVDRVIKLNPHIGDITGANKFLNESGFNEAEAMVSAVEVFIKEYMAGRDQSMKHPEAMEYARANWQNGGGK